MTVILTHAIERTSPKGEPFRGTCWQCGLTNLPMSAAQLPCTNTKGYSRDASLIRAMEAKKK